MAVSGHNAWLPPHGVLASEILQRWPGALCYACFTHTCWLQMPATLLSNQCRAHASFCTHAGAGGRRRPEWSLAKRLNPPCKEAAPLRNGADKGSHPQHTFPGLDPDWRGLLFSPTWGTSAGGSSSGLSFTLWNCLWLPRTGTCWTVLAKSLRQTA